MTRVNIVLCGFMASGKTTVGKILAELTGKEFVDTDDEVEATGGRRISTIFREDGEPSFRRLEREIVSGLAEKNDLVIAVGGGAVLDRRNVEDLKHRGVIYLLEVTVDEAIRRAGDGGERPLMNSQSDEVAMLMGGREGAYSRAADVVIDTGDRTPEEIASLIARDFESRISEGGD